MSALARIDELLQRLGESGDARAVADAQALVAAILALHKEALAKLVEGHPALGALARDPAVGSVLLLHELHPDGIEARVQAALDQLQPALAAQHVAATLVACSAAAVRVRLAASGDGQRKATAEALRALVEAALYDVAPEAGDISVDASALGEEWDPLESTCRHASLSIL